MRPMDPKQFRLEQMRAERLAMAAQDPRVPTDMLALTADKFGRGEFVVTLADIQALPEIDRAV